MTHKALILAFTTWDLQRKGSTTRWRGESSNSGWRPCFKNVCAFNISSVILVVVACNAGVFWQARSRASTCHYRQRVTQAGNELDRHEKYLAEGDLRWPTTVTAKYNSSRQNKIWHGKIKFETTNSNYSGQITNTHGKSKNNYCNSKLITARAKRSRQEQNTRGKSQTLTAKSNQEYCQRLSNYAV